MYPRPPLFLWPWPSLCGLLDGIKSHLACVWCPLQLCTAEAHQELLEKVAKVYEENKKARRKAGLADAVDSGAEEEGSDSDSSEEEGSDSGSGGSGSSGSEEDGSEVRTRPHPPLSLSSSALICPVERLPC